MKTARAASNNTAHQRGIRIDPSSAYDLNPAQGIMAARPSSSGPSRRPDFGTCGRAVQLRTNHFPILNIPDALYEYHVEISPAALVPSITRRIYQLAEQTTVWEQAGMVGTVAHDEASRLISSEPLPHLLEILVHFHTEGTPLPPRNDRYYKLTIKFVKVLDMGNVIGHIQGRPGFRNHNVSPAVSALNLIQLVARGNAGRRSHFLNIQSTTIGGGLEARREFRATLCPARGRLTVRVDLTTTPYYIPGNLVTLMSNFPSEHVNRCLSGLAVDITHFQLSRPQKIIRRFADENSNTHMVETHEFGRITAREFFSRKFGIQLQFPHLRLAGFGPQSFLPPEVCTVLPGQCFRRRMTEGQTQAVLGMARVSPNENENMIKQFGQQPMGPILSSSGMDIGTDMLEVRGRVLPKPMIIYSSKTTHANVRGHWDLLGAKFVVGAQLDRWAVLVISDGGRAFAGVTKPELTQAVSAFRDMCNEKGMNVRADPTYAAVEIPSRDADPTGKLCLANIKDRLLRIKPKPQAVLVALPNRDQLLYQGLKYLCDVILDVTTICVVSAKFRPPRPKYLSSLALKFNLKLGGTNHRLDAKSIAWLNEMPTMVVGTGIRMPELSWYRSPSAFTTEDLPPPTPFSIAALTASVDEHFAQYPVSLTFQTSWGEILTELEVMMTDRLKYYQSQNEGRLPERVLMYRSGVSEARFDILLSTEIPRVTAAFRSFDKPDEEYRPKLTVVVCCQNQRTWFSVDGVGNGSPEPGTVVDRDVTSPYNFDFYLQAHGGVAGTVRPTLYTVIYNEMNAKADEIQGATHALSYMYAPATHAVSLAAPVHYADLACKRARCYLQGLPNGLGEVDVGKKAAAMGRVPGWGLSSTMFYI